MIISNNGIRASLVRALIADSYGIPHRTGSAGSKPAAIHNDALYKMYAKVMGKPGVVHTFQKIGELQKKNHIEREFRASPEGQALTKLEKAEARLKRADKAVELSHEDWFDEVYDDYLAAKREYKVALREYNQIRNS